MKKDNIIRPKPVLLCILDGWGIAPEYSGNAVSNAQLPAFKDFINKYPIAALSASGEAAGVPWGDMGNSKVGHINLGSGRIIYQDLPRINKSISDNSFFQNQAFTGALDHVKKFKSNLHLMGLLSNGGVHAAIEHLMSLLILASQNEIKKVFIHLFLDGRDMSYKSAQKLVGDLQKTIEQVKVGQIATMSGRFYAMDRDNNWDRIQKAYQAIAIGEAEKIFATPDEAFDYYYGKDVYDEEFTPTVIATGQKIESVVQDNDAIIYFNFRADRAREMTKVFAVPSFDKFDRRKEFKNLFFVTMTEYEKNLPVEVAFKPEKIINTLGEVIAKNNLRQLRIAETEKYAHVTYFFNGGVENPYANEDRIVIPSPRVESYADQPKMSAPEVTERLIKEIDKNIYDFILINYANADMVGHTGNMDAAVAALEYLDTALKELAKVVLEKNGVMIITADHGNVEEMFDMQTGSINKEHSTNPVPFLIIGKDYEGKKIDATDISGFDLSILHPQGILADVAPTILKIMGLQQPPEMTGRSLI